MRGFIKTGIYLLGLFILIWAATINLTIVYRALGGGWSGGTACFLGMSVFLPITLLFVPWFALLIQGVWFPLMVTYGGGIVFLLVLKAYDTGYRGRDERRS